MYSYIKGTIEEVYEDLIVVENGGLGDNIHVPLRVLDELPGRGGQVKIYTYLHVREDAFTLFGFLSRDEIGMFRLLLNVSGIGPRGALSVLSVLSANEIRFAVASDDVKTNSSAPGVGKKTAQRLIMELKDKVSIEDAVGTLQENPELVSHGGNAVKKEAAEALTALGYSGAEAAKVLAGIEITEESDVESVLKQALKNMAFL